MVTEVACGNNSSGPEWTAGAQRVNGQFMHQPTNLKNYSNWTWAIFQNFKNNMCSKDCNIYDAMKKQESTFLNAQAT